VITLTLPQLVDAAAFVFPEDARSVISGGKPPYAGGHRTDNLRSMSPFEVFISSLSFGAQNPSGVDRLHEHGISVRRNETGKRLTGREIADLAAGCRAVISGTDDLSLLVEESTTLRLIVRLGVGLDGVPVDECRERGIEVVTTPDAVTDSVAEFALGLILAGLRHIPVSDRGLRQGDWPRRLGQTVSSTTVGIVGFGRIGRRVAELLVPFHPQEILLTDILPPSRLNVGTVHVDLETLLTKADVVSLHLPLTDETRGLFGATEFAAMKRDAVFVNTSRGGLVDEHALMDKLRTDPEFVAALDVFTFEPYNGELITVDSTILTSHIASNTAAARSEMDRIAVDAVLKFMRGSPDSV
jgi:D-3-phosphoglycerate dehydrogenase